MSILKGLKTSVDNNRAKPGNVISLENRSISHLSTGSPSRFYFFDHGLWKFELSYLYNHNQLRLAIIDNHKNSIGNATAIDTNFSENINDLIREIRHNINIPKQKRILDLLVLARSYFPPTTPQWPQNVKIIIFNAMGYSNTISPRLEGKGIQFVDVHDEGQLAKL